MADNTPVSNGTGDIIRDIDRGGVKTQVMQLDVGGAAGEVLVSEDNPVPVALPAAQIAALAPGAPITGYALDASLGTDGTTPPALPGGSTGVRGWLRAILAALSGTLTTARNWTLSSGTDSVTTVPSGTQAVSASALPLPAGAATDAGQAAIVTAIQGISTGGGGGTISGTVALDAPTLAALESISVQNFPATQPVSAASLPLPTGASTVAGQAAIVTALGAPLQAGGAVSVSNLPATQAVSAASLPLPTGAATAANQASEITALAQLHSDLIASLPAGTNAIGAVSVSNLPPTISIGGSQYAQVDPSNAGTDGAAYNATNFPQVGVVAGRGSDGNAHAVSVDSAGNLNVNVSTGSSSPAAALPGLQTPDNAGYVAIVGDPNGDFAGVDLMGALLDDSQGLAARVKVTNQPLADVQGAARASDAPVAIPLTGGVGTIITIDTTGYESLNITSLSMAANVTASDDPNGNFAALSGTNRTIAAAYVTAIAANGGYSFPCIARFVRLTLSTAGTGVAYLRAAPWVAGYSTPLPSNVAQLNGTAPVTANVAGTLAVGGNIAAGVAPTMFPLPTGSVDAAGLTRRVLSDAAGALTVGGVDPNGTQRQVKTDPTGVIAIQQEPSTAGAPNSAETLVQILGQLKVLTIYMREMSSALNAGVPLADDEAAILQDPTLFN